MTPRPRPRPTETASTPTDLTSYGGIITLTYSDTMNRYCAAHVGSSIVACADTESAALRDLADALDHAALDEPRHGQD